MRRGHVEREGGPAGEGGRDGLAGGHVGEGIGGHRPDRGAVDQDTEDLESVVGPYQEGRTAPVANLDPPRGEDPTVGSRRGVNDVAKRPAAAVDELEYQVLGDGSAILVDQVAVGIAAARGCLEKELSRRRGRVDPDEVGGSLVERHVADIEVLYGRAVAEGHRAEGGVGEGRAVPVGAEGDRDALVGGSRFTFDAQADPVHGVGAAAGFVECLAPGGVGLDLETVVVDGDAADRRDTAAGGRRREGRGDGPRLVRGQGDGVVELRADRNVAAPLHELVAEARIGGHVDQLALLVPAVHALDFPVGARGGVDGELASPQPGDRRGFVQQEGAGVAPAPGSGHGAGSDPAIGDPALPGAAGDIAPRGCGHGAVVADGRSNWRAGDAAHGVNGERVGVDGKLGVDRVIGHHVDEVLGMDLVALVEVIDRHAVHGDALNVVPGSGGDHDIVVAVGGHDDLAGGNDRAVGAIGGGDGIGKGRSHRCLAGIVQEVGIGSVEAAKEGSIGEILPGEAVIGEHVEHKGFRETGADRPGGPDPAGVGAERRGRVRQVQTRRQQVGEFHVVRRCRTGVRDGDRVLIDSLFQGRAGACRLVDCEVGDRLECGADRLVGGDVEEVLGIDGVRQPEGAHRDPIGEYIGNMMAGRGGHHETGRGAMVDKDRGGGGDAAVGARAGGDGVGVDGEGGMDGLVVDDVAEQLRVDRVGLREGTHAHAVGLHVEDVVIGRSGHHETRGGTVLDDHRGGRRDRAVGPGGRGDRVGNDGRQVEHVHRASVRSAIVILLGAHGDVDVAVAIDVADAGHGGTESVVVIEGGAKAAGQIADLLVCLDGSVRVQEEDVYRTPVRAAVVIPKGADGDIGGAVRVNVSDAGYRNPEPVDVVECRGEAARGVGDFLLGPDGSVRVQEQDVDRPPVRAAVVVVFGADRDFADSVTVEVADARDRPAEVVRATECGAEAARGVTDLLFGLDGAVRTEPQDIDRTVVRTAIVVGVGTHGEVVDAVAVDVADRADGAAELVAVVKGCGEAAHGVGDLLPGPDGPVRIQEDDVDRPPVGAAVVILRTADSQVDDPVAVDIAEARNRPAELVAVVKGCGEAARGVGNLLLGLDGSVRVQEQDVDRTPIHAAVVVLRGADGDVVDTVAVEIADPSYALAEVVVVMERGHQFTQGVTDLLFGLDGSVGRTRWQIEIIRLPVTIRIDGIAWIAVCIRVGVLSAGRDAVVVVVIVEIVRRAVPVGVRSGVGRGVVVGVGIGILLVVPEPVAVGVLPGDGREGNRHRVEERALDRGERIELRLPSQVGAHRREGEGDAGLDLEERCPASVAEVEAKVGVVGHESRGA